jgi:SecD/SecF fusion protein
MRRKRLAFLLFPLAGVAVVLGASVAAGGDRTSSVAASTAPSLELVFRMEAGEERLTPSTRSEAMEILGKRLQAIGAPGGEVHALANRRVRVLVPGVESIEQEQRAAEQIGEAGRLYFYDWELNLIGRERRVGGHPGVEPPAGALTRANREWRAAGRNISQPANTQLIFAGAFPSVYGAVRLASEQKPREHCAACAASAPRFYMFSRTRDHELVAGPAGDRAGLRIAAAGQRLHHGVVVEVPVGTTIVSEQPFDSSGERIVGAEPGWFALRDRPALKGADIIHPTQETDEFGRPNVTFGFTGKGRAAFHRVTRKIARRGRASAIGPVGAGAAEVFSGHLAVVFDGEVMTRPIVNFADFPNGVDGRVGAQISGGFATAQEAHDLARTLKIGGLPIDMALVRQRLLR